MIQYLALFIILFSHSSFAQNPHEGGLKPESIVPDSTYQSCVESVCGKAESTPNLFEEKKFEDLPQSLQISLSSKYDKVFKKKEAEFAAKLKRLSEMPDEAMEKLSLSSEQVAGLAAGGLLQFIEYKDTPSDLDTEIDSLEFSEEKTLKSLPDRFSKEFKSKVLSIIRNPAVLQLDKKLKNIFMIPFELYTKLKHPGMNHSEIAATYLSRIEDSTNETSASEAENPNENPYTAYIEEFRKKTIFSKEDLKQLMMVTEFLSADLALKKHFKKNKVKITLGEFIKNFGIREKALKLIDLTPEKHREEATLAKAQHLNSFAKAYLKSPTDYDKSKLKEETNKEFNRIIRVIFSSFSAITKRNFPSEEVPLSLPPTQEEVLAQFNKHYKKAMTEKKSKDANDEMVDLSLQIDHVNIGNRNNATARFENHLSGVFHNLNKRIYNGDVCFMNHGGAVVISGFSVTNPELGSPITRHELGHLIQARLANTKVSDKSYKSFKDTFSCLSNQHPKVGSEDDLLKVSLMNKEGKKTKIENLGPQTYEDWADLISFSTSKPGEKNFACALFRQENNKYAKVPLQEDKAIGPHSTALFRMLHGEFIKGAKFSKECSKMMKKHYPDFSFKKCL